FANDNSRFYFDYNQINAAGGFAKAGASALLNTTEGQNRLRVRVRFGFDTDLGSGWTTGLRLATRSTGEVFSTRSQPLGPYGAGYTTTFDQPYLRWTGQSSTARQIFTAYGGRFENPWLASDLLWYSDLTFEGVVTNYRLNLSRREWQPRHDLFVTL